MASIEPLLKIKSVNIDFPFVQPNDFRTDGKLATSFDTVMEMIDRAIQLGFNTISFDTNVPINAQTGEIQLAVMGDTNGDKSFPQAIWESVKYAESKGLKTILDLNIRNALNDVPIMTSNVGQEFNVTTFFDSVKRYETEIARKAEIYGVDGICLGKFNFGFVSNEYVNNWLDVVKSIKSVYKGTLSYQSNVEDSGNSLWDLVDQVRISLSPAFNLKPNYTKDDIAPLYLGSYTMGNGELSNDSIYSKIQFLSTKYTNKVLFLEVSFQPGQSAGHETEIPWNYVFAENPLLINAKDPNSLVPYPEGWIDPKLNQEKISGFFEFFGNYLEDIVTGIEYYQYAPWTEAAWIRSPDPQNLIGQVWQSIQRAGLSLNWSPESEVAIASYLLREWGFNTLHYGTSKADYLSGTQLEDKFFSSHDDDVYHGGASLDTAVYTGTYGSHTVANQSNGSFVVTDSISGRDGTDTVTNVERLQFSDYNVALDTDSANSAGGIYRLYQAAFDRKPDLGGLGYWIKAADNSKSAVTMAEDFTWSKEFLDLFHLTTPKDNYFTGVDVKTLVEGMYTHVLHRAADSGGLNYYAGVIQSHEKTVGRVLAEISDSPENHTAVASSIANGIQYTPYTAQAMTSLHLIDDIEGTVAEPQKMALDSYSSYSDQVDLVGQAHDSMLDWMWLG